MIEIFWPGFFFFFWPTRVTYAGAAHGDEAKSLDDAGRANDPRQTDEEDDAENVLHAREIDAGQGAELGRALGLVGRIRIRWRLDSGTVVGQRADQRSHSRAAFLALLLKHRRPR